MSVTTYIIYGILAFIIIKIWLGRKRFKREFSIGYKKLKEELGLNNKVEYPEPNSFIGAE